MQRKCDRMGESLCNLQCWKHDWWNVKKTKNKKQTTNYLELKIRLHTDSGALFQNHNKKKHDLWQNGVPVTISTLIRLMGQQREKCHSTDSSVLLFALAGSFGRWCDGSSRLVESSGYFVDVVQSEEGEDQAEQEERKKYKETCWKKWLKKFEFKYFQCWWGFTYQVVTQTRCTRPEANSDKHKHSKTEKWHKWALISDNYMVLHLYNCINKVHTKKSLVNTL